MTDDPANVKRSISKHVEPAAGEDEPLRKKVQAAAKKIDDATPTNTEQVDFNDPKFGKKSG